MFVHIAILFLCGLACYYYYEKQTNSQKADGLKGYHGKYPWIGNLFEMINLPYLFYEKQEWLGELTWNYFCGHFVLFSSSTSINKQIFKNPNNRLFLHMNAKKILGENNIAFMHGDPHKKLRNKLTPLFTKNALSKYLSIQEEIIRQHVKTWPKESFPARNLIRDMNIYTSIKTFTGEYLNKDQTLEFIELYLCLNEGILAIPINLPGTRLNNGIKARHKLVAMLEKCVLASKERVKSNEMSCLLDYWMKNEETAEYKEKDCDIALHILDFLFASQDASTSSLMWALDQLDDEKVKSLLTAEHLSIFSSSDQLMTLEHLNSLKYTRNVVMELLRLRPAATMVPHMNNVDIPIAYNSKVYTVPKGTIILPSLWAAHKNPNNFPEPDKFIPERFADSRRDSSLENFMAFGYGPHACLGKEYAINHLTLFISVILRNYGWTRIPIDHTKQYDDRYLLAPTCGPKDGCVVKWDDKTKSKDLLDHFTIGNNKFSYNVFTGQVVIFETKEHITKLNSENLIVDDKTRNGKLRDISVFEKIWETNGLTIEFLFNGEIYIPIKFKYDNYWK